MILCEIFWCVECLLGVSKSGLCGFSLGWSVCYGLVTVIMGFCVVVSDA